MDAPFDHVAESGAVADITVFRAAKRGQSWAEYEDAAAASSPERLPLHAAVADGATESAYARRWAQILAAGWVEHAPRAPDELVQAVPAWRQSWQRDASEKTRGQPWYAVAKIEQGAFAALLGLTLHPSGAWHALGLGDCNLFHLRDDTVRLAWPLQDPDAFSHRPELLSSRSSPSEMTPDATQGTWTAGDTFLLASDAVAAWLLRVGPPAGRTLDAASFAPRIRQARGDGALRNDDATLVRISLRVA